MTNDKQGTTIIGEMLAQVQADALTRGHVLSAFERVNPRPRSMTQFHPFWHARCLVCDARVDVSDLTNETFTGAVGQVLTDDCPAPAERTPLFL